MTNWKALLLVYPRIDVRYPISPWRRRRFTNQLSGDEIEEALASFAQFPALVGELTAGRVTVSTEVIHVARALDSLSAISWGGFWPAPADTRIELDALAPRDRFDSVFIFWPQANLQTGVAIPSGGWGFGMGASNATHGATYATVANAPTASWRVPRVGEVWLHEWLHGVCHHFAQRGERLPDGDADGGGRHGYVQSPKSGWMDYYRDLMNGQVEEAGKLTGIRSDAWLVERGSETLPA